MKKASKNPRHLILKVKSYEKFKEIAHTIQLVSISILTKYEWFIKTKNLLYISFFFKKLESFYNWKEDSFCYKFLIIILTADKSCCGALNSNIIQTVNLFLKSFLNNNFSFKIFFYGLYGLNLMKRKFKKIIYYTIYNLPLDKFNYPFIGSKIVYDIINFDFDRIFIFFNLYNNRIIQKCGKQDIPSYDILWFNYWKFKYFFDRIGLVLIFKKLNDTFILYLVSIFLNSICDNELSSYGARAKTMENAVSNTEKTILYLKLRYNKLRQFGITSQIIEVLNASIAS